MASSAILDRRRHSSAVEQLFRKQQVLGSNPSVGSTPPLVLRKSSRLELARSFPANEDLLTGEDMLTRRIPEVCATYRTATRGVSRREAHVQGHEDLLSSTQQSR